MNRRLTILLIIAFAIFGCNSNKQSADDGIFKIGLNLTLSGNGSYYGQEFKKGFDLAIEQLSKHNGADFQLIYEDNRFNQQEAVGITKKLIEIDKVDLLISGYTPILKAIIPVVERSRIPLIGSMSSAVNLASNKKWMIRDFTIEDRNMAILAEYVIGNNYNTGTYFVVNDDYGHDARDGFITHFEKLGGSIVSGEVFESNHLDQRTKLRKLLIPKPEIILVVGRGSAMVNIIKQIRELDADVLICCSNPIENEIIWKGLGVLGEGIIFPNIRIPYESSKFLMIDSVFQSTYDHKMNWVSIFGYTTAEYAAQALITSKADKSATRDLLKKLNTGSIRGRLFTNENNDIITDLVIYKRSGNKSIIQ